MKAWAQCLCFPYPPCPFAPTAITATIPAPASAGNQNAETLPSVQLRAQTRRTKEQYVPESRILWGGWVLQHRLRLWVEFTQNQMLRFLTPWFPPPHPTIWFLLLGWWCLPWVDSFPPPHLWLCSANTANGVCVCRGIRELLRCRSVSGPPT